MTDANPVLFSPWFGPWPVWINLFLESCRWNPWVTWVIPTDQDPPENQPPNVRFLPISLDAFTARASQVCSLTLAPASAYKICDFKPLLGQMFRDDIAGHSHFGYCDNDVIFGQLAFELTPERLARCDVISTHETLLSGHLTVLRNSDRMVQAWRLAPRWRERLASPHNTWFDEGPFGRAFNPRRFQWPWRRFTAHWEEMYTTPGTRMTWSDGGPVPTCFTWKDGRITEPRNARPEYIYLHFMNWRSRRYRRDRDTPPWDQLDQIVKVDWRTVARDGFQISHDGFTPVQDNDQLTA